MSIQNNEITKNQNIPSSIDRNIKNLTTFISLSKSKKSELTKSKESILAKSKK